MIDVVGRRAPGQPPLDLVEAFINSEDLETGSEELLTASAFRDWLLNRYLIKRSDSVTAKDLQRATELRRALREAVLRNTKGGVDAKTMRALNTLAHGSHLLMTFGEDGTARLEPSASGVEAAFARILATVFTAISAGTWERLKGCANESCQWAFYDSSKNRSRRWCEMADCGNDAKGRTYRRGRRNGARS